MPRQHVALRYGHPVTMQRHVDVLIIGAGISGIGAACHLTRDLPERSYAILERRHSIGGTWDLFRYPGVRSDSDMYTFGFNFRPWLDTKVLADGDVDPQLRQRDGRRVRRARAHHLRPQGDRRELVERRRSLESSPRWTKPMARPRRGPASSSSCAPATTTTTRVTVPSFPASSDFGGELIHPQHWPDDLDYRGKRCRRDRQWRDRGHAGAGDGRRRRPRDDAAALPHVHRRRCLPSTRSRSRCAACFRTS